jgi:predicted metal-dependent enzyme (double-stranded beta helix superfamily)
MASETYTLEQFVSDLDRITARETAPEAITTQIAPLLERLVKNPDAIPARFRGRAQDGGRGRFMLHRAPRFNVTAVVWRPGDRAAAHNHETWGVIGVIGNEIEETRYRVTEHAGGPATLAVLSVTRHGAGAVSRLVPPADEVHAMHNPTTRHGRGPRVRQGSLRAAPQDVGRGRPRLAARQREIRQLLSHPTQTRRTSTCR